MKSLFLDRDGIINRDKGYVYKREDIEFNPDAFRLMLQAQLKGYQIFIISNQSGIARGMFTEHDVHQLHSWMNDIFLSNNIKVAEFIICPDHPDGTVAKYTGPSLDRKPNGGMVRYALEKYGGSIYDSLVVGDKPSDRIRIEGLRSVILRSQYSKDIYDVTSLKEVTKRL